MNDNNQTTSVPTRKTREFSPKCHQQRQQETPDIISFATGKRVEFEPVIKTITSFEEWNAEWKTSSTGFPYRRAEELAIGIKKMSKTGFHWWINESIRHARASEYTWSTGFPTQEAAQESVYEYLHSGATVNCTSTYTIAGDEVTEEHYRRNV